MKKIAILLTALILFSCEKNVEVIKISDPDYATQSEVDTQVRFEQEDLDVILNLLKQNNSPEVKLFIDEEGELKRIIFLDKVSSETGNDLVAKIKELEFNPAMKDGKPVKSQYQFAKPQSEYFVAVEHMPEPIGGIKAIQEKIVYPEIAKRAGIEGRVYVKAYIDENGDVTKVELIKGLADGAFWSGDGNAGVGLEEEAMRAVKETKFIPGNQRGHKVKTQVSVPILFKLK